MVKTETGTPTWFFRLIAEQEKFPNHRFLGGCKMQKNLQSMCCQRDLYSSFKRGRLNRICLKSFLLLSLLYVMLLLQRE